IRQAQARLVEIADQPIADMTAEPRAPTLAQFLASLRTAWQSGEIRPRSRTKETKKRGRRRPDPLAMVTADLRAWFDAEPWRTSRELFERLQTAHPGKFPDRAARSRTKWCSVQPQIIPGRRRHAFNAVERPRSFGPSRKSRQLVRDDALPQHG